MQTACFGRSELELRRPGNGLNMDARRSRGGAFSAAVRADPESADERGDRGSAVANARNRNPRSAILE
eukprot:4874844-Alexandrium_andersonii.AAC.1